MSGPLIVQSDKTVLLEVDHPQANQARAALASVGLEARAGDWPAVLSGGHVSIAATVLGTWAYFLIKERRDAVAAERATGRPFEPGEIDDHLADEARARQVARLTKKN